MISSKATTISNGRSHVGGFCYPSGKDRERVYCTVSWQLNSMKLSKLDGVDPVDNRPCTS